MAELSKANVCAKQVNRKKRMDNKLAVKGFSWVYLCSTSLPRLSSVTELGLRALRSEPAFKIPAPNLNRLL